jgi:hypothetical protein
VLEIRICPETAIEFKAALQLVTTLAGAEAGAEPPKPRTKPWELRATKPEAVPAAQPATVASDTASDPDDIPYPPFDDPRPACSRQQVLDALQEYAQTNGAVALKEVLDRFGARRVSDIKPEHYPEVLTIARGELA